MSNKHHWETVYITKAATAVSWHQPEAARSLRLIRDACLAPSDPIVDVGGGASTLVDGLLPAGYCAVTVLDLSGAALVVSRKRLGDKASKVCWLEGDVLHPHFVPGSMALWHDRAVFHFLTQPEDRTTYVQRAREALRPGGHLIVATFAEDGPLQCSGLPVCRYGAAQLAAEFVDGFVLESSEAEAHPTPFGTSQSFLYCHFRRG